MTFTRCLLTTFASLFLGLTATAQTAHPRTSTGGTTSNATKEDTFSYLRGKLIDTSNNGAYPVDVEKVGEGCQFHSLFPGNIQTIIFFANLDANTLSWSVIADGKGGKLLALDVTSDATTNAHAFPAEIFQQNGLDRSQRNFARFPFSLSRVAAIPDFQAKFSKAVKHFIQLCGGTPEQNLF